MTDLERNFHNELLDTYYTVKNETGYDAKILFKLIQQKGGLNAAKQLISKPGGTYGYMKLAQFNKLNLSVEALVQKDEYRALFSDSERMLCQEKLKQYGYIKSDAQIEQTTKKETITPSSSAERMNGFLQKSEELRINVINLANKVNGSKCEKITYVSDAANCLYENGVISAKTKDNINHLYKTRNRVAHPKNSEDSELDDYIFELLDKTLQNIQSE